MATLITRVRLLINDPNSGSQHFSDDQVQDALDETRDDVRYEQLKAAPTLVNTGGTALYVWDTYFSAYEWWESDVVISDAKFATITPVAAELLKGKWTFTSVAPGQVPPVFATGKVYDPYYAAADLLEFWATALADTFDFSADGQSFKASQKSQARMAMAARYRMRAKPKAISAVRTDVYSPSTISTVPLLGNNDVITR